MPVFTANVPRTLKIGDRIEIGGKIKENAKKMSINLCAQLGDEPRDVVLHFDVRFRRDNIVSLSRKNGIWIGSGSYDTNYNMFVPGTVFRIVFQVKDADVIKIYCQGKFHSNFLPKIPISMAHYVVAWCDIERITECFFYFADMTASGDETSQQRLVSPQLSVLKKSLKSKKQVQDNVEHSEEDLQHTCKGRGPRADRYFYETLMCQSPGSLKLVENMRRRPSDTRSRDECRRRLPNTSEDTDSTVENSDESTVSCSTTESESIDKCRSKRRPVRSPDVNDMKNLTIKKC